MLTIQQLAKLKSSDPYLYESLRQIVAAVNALGRATGVDPAGFYIELFSGHDTLLA